MRLNVLSILLILSAQAVNATALPDCEALAERIANETGIPAGVMASIARVEAGYNWPSGEVKAWPWTVNRSGKSDYFQSKVEMTEVVEAAILSGEDNIDLGCMQINLRWHGDHFSTLDDMIDPERNIQYAAGFLLELRDTHGSWQKAISHYHSADPDRGRAYFAKVNAAFESRETSHISNKLKRPTQTKETVTSHAQNGLTSNGFADQYARHIVPMGRPKFP